jgi:hypothetical protein
VSTILDSVLAMFGIYRYVPTEVIPGHWVDRVTRTHFDCLPSDALLIDLTDEALRAHPVGGRVEKGTCQLDMTTSDNVMQYGFPARGNRTRTYHGRYRVWQRFGR